MAARLQRRTSGKPRGTAVLAVLSLVVGLLGLGVQLLPASATLPGVPGSQTTFDAADGNESVETSDGETDWDSPPPNLQEIDDDPSGATDSSMSTSEDDVTPKITAGSIQDNKADLLGIKAAYERVGVKDYLYLSWTRPADPSGNVDFDFELNKAEQPPLPAAGQVWNLNRTEGDILLTFELLQGGTAPKIALRRWVTTGGNKACDSNPSTPCWGPATYLTPTSIPAAEGSVNQLANGDITFGEMAIDLGLAGIFTVDQCTSFASVYAKSRSSGSGFNSQISDVVPPEAVRVTNCGAITVTKDITGPVLAGDPATFSFTVACPATVDLDPTTAGIQNTKTFSLADGASSTVPNIPPAVTCTVTEADPAPDNYGTTWAITGGASGSGRQVSISNVPLSGKTVTFTNARNTGGLTVTKTVSGGAGGESFGFTVACTGHTLLSGDASFNLADGGTKSISGIPVDAECTVTETNPGSNWSTTRSINGATATSGRAATVTMDTGGESVAFTNTRNTGQLRVTKATSGGTGTFSFTASCTGHSLAAGDAAFSLSGGGLKTISGIPTGTSCTVTESDPGTNWSTTYSVDGSAPTAGRSTSSAVDGDGTTIAFTNTRNTASFVVSKSVVGPTNASDATSFDFTLSCTGVTLAAGDASFSLASGASKTVSGIPTGTSCTVTETNPGTGWTTTRSVDGATATTSRTATSSVDTDGTTVAFTNTRDTAGFIVSKTVVGPTNAADPTTFAFSVSCTGYSVAAGDAAFSLASGASRTISGIPTGTSCTVTETNPGSGWTTTRSVDGAAATESRTATASVDADGTSVAFTNTRQTGALTVTKTATGDTGTFDFTVACTGFTLASGDASFSLGGGGSKTISGIPTGTGCTVTETDPGTRWSTSTKVDAAAPVAGRSATTTVDADGTTVAVTNVRKTGSLTITKATTGGNGTFSFAVDCVGTAFDQTVVVTTAGGAGSSTPITGIPTETDCTVTETVPAGWAAVGGVSRTVTIDVDGETAAFSNRKLVPGIDVTKAASAPVVHNGTSVTYTYVVTNKGETPLSDVTVVDDKCATVAGPAAGNDVGRDGVLGLTEVWTYTCTSILTATTTNVVTATGTDPLDADVSDTATATVTVINPRIAIDKAPSATSVEPGTTVVYTYTVTNPGDVPLTAVTVSDDKCSPVTLARGDANRDGILQLTETWVFTCSQVQTGAVDTLTNVGTARGLDPLGAAVTSNDTVTVAVVAPLVLAAPPAPAPAPVATAPVTLPRTGIDVRGWIQLGGSLLLLGVALLLTSRTRRAA